MMNSPEADHQKIQDWMVQTGTTYVDFYFDGENDKKHQQAMAELPDDVREAGSRLTEEIVSSEIGQEWADGDGSTGHVRYMPGQSPWLDADDREDDWTFEREIDLEDIEYEHEPETSCPDI